MEQRKASIHLCCKKLTIFAMPVENITKVLNMVQLDCVQELQVNWIWHLSTLAKFAPLLGQMSNMQRLHLSRIHMSALEKQEQQEQQVVQFTSQFLKLHHLQDLYLDSPSFLEGCLDQMLRWVWNTVWKQWTRHWHVKCTGSLAALSWAVVSLHHWNQGRKTNTYTVLESYVWCGLDPVRVDSFLGREIYVTWLTKIGKFALQTCNQSLCNPYVICW